MNLDTLESLLKESLRAIRLCLENELCNSATVLFYCGIDTASSLDLAYDGNSVQLRYTKWCDAYMLKNETYDFTSLELYSARCGMVHETSVRSNLTEQGKAREIIYAWGDSDVALLREMNELAQMNDCVAVQFEALVRAYEIGLTEFVQSLRSNKERADFALKKAEKCLSTRSNNEIQSLLEWGKSKLPSKG